MDGLGIKNGRNGLLVVSYDVWVGGSGWMGGLGVAHRRRRPSSSRGAGMGN